MKEQQTAAGRNKQDLQYEDWLKKFEEHEKTTDDTFTPKEVYELVKNYMVEKFKLEGRRIIRPFYPGGDYKNFNYHPGDVVIDNPPFSILNEIKDFYTINKIDFLLFAPGLTLFTKGDRKNNINYIITGENVVFENGAKINISFVTNMGDNLIETAPELGQAIRKNQKQKLPKPKHEYPKNVFNPAKFNTLSKQGKKIIIKNTARVKHTRALESMKKEGIAFFGGGLMFTDEEVEKIEQAPKIKIKENEQPEVLRFELSEEEKQWIKGENNEQ